MSSLSSLRSALSVASKLDSQYCLPGQVWTPKSGEDFIPGLVKFFAEVGGRVVVRSGEHLFVVFGDWLPEVERAKLVVRFYGAGAVVGMSDDAAAALVRRVLKPLSWAPASWGSWRPRF